MKKFIKRILPSGLSDYISKLNYRGKQSPFKGLGVQEVFSHIYKTNYWGHTESVSGAGSSVVGAQTIIEALSDLFNRLNISRVLDIPCGDFNWMQQVDLTGIDYTGADIVPDLILENKKRFEQEALRFEELDIISDKLPAADLVLCRDCLVHFSFRNIFDATENILRSGSKYLMATTFLKHKLNYDIVTGDWRPLNLEKPPFNFPKPIDFVQESHDTELGRRTKIKGLGVWKISDLKRAKIVN